MNLYIKFFSVLTLALVIPGIVQAGWLSNSIGNSIAKKSAGKAAQKAITRKVITKNSVSSLSSAERAALQRVLKQLDQKTLISIRRKFGRYITPEKLRLAQTVPVVFKDKSAYQRYLKKVFPNTSPTDRARILGTYEARGNRLVVNQNNPLLPRVVAHERIHQLGHPGFTSITGNDMKEGMTEYFASKIYGDMAIKGGAKFYPKQYRVVEMMHARVGFDPLARAYFKGDLRTLQRSIDDQLGSGALAKISRAMKFKDYIGAEKILRRGSSLRYYSLQ